MAPIDGPKPPVPLSILEPHVYIHTNVFLYDICVLLSIYMCDGLSLYVFSSVCPWVPKWMSTSVVSVGSVYVYRSLTTCEC